MIQFHSSQRQRVEGFSGNISRKEIVAPDLGMGDGIQYRSPKANPVGVLPVLGNRRQPQLAQL
jgi:hypothetical protein